MSGSDARAGLRTECLTRAAGSLRAPHQRPFVRRLRQLRPCGERCPSHPSRGPLQLRRPPPDLTDNLLLLPVTSIASTGNHESAAVPAAAAATAASAFTAVPQPVQPARTSAAAGVRAAVSPWAASDAGRAAAPSRAASDVLRTAARPPGAAVGAADVPDAADTAVPGAPLRTAAEREW